MAQSQMMQAVLKAEGGPTTAEDLQKNAKGKQYNVKYSFTTTETNGDKPYADVHGSWTGLPYSMVVVLENELKVLLDKLVTLGGEIATGGAATPPAS